MSVGFTDDEIVGLALDAKEDWRAVLPSIDVLDEEALFASAVRGQRTLTVRGLRPGTGTKASPALDTAAAVQRVCGTTPRYAFYGATAAEPAVSRGMVVSFFALPDDTGFLVDVANRNGIHDVEVMSDGGAQAFADKLIADVWEKGLGDESPTDAVFVLLSGTDRSAVVIEGRSARSAVVNVDDGIPAIELAEEASTARPRLLLAG